MKEPSGAYSRSKGAGVTIEMVAEAAGVSPSTVSRILNGSARVKEAKKAAVEAAIARLHFVPNPAARLLAMGKSMTIGVIAQSIDSPFYGEGLRGIEDGLTGTDFAVLFTSGHWSADTERHCISQLLSRRVDGIIFLTSCLPGADIAALAADFPVVVTGREVKATSKSHRLHCLEFEHAKGARLATEHLIGLGHRRIAFIGGPRDHPDAVQRLRGYKQALAAAGLDFDERLLAGGNYREAGGEAAMAALLDAKARFTAVLAANDQTAYGACLALYRRKLRVPQDISVVGFDDLPGSMFTLPPLTSVHQAIYETGQAAAKAVIDLIEGRQPTLAVPAPALAIRESTRRLG